MSEYEQAIFISYAWGGQREEIVNQIERALQDRGLKIIRDKRELGYKGSIKGFMERIGQGNCVIIVLSDKYLRSQSCMFELVEIAENKQFHDRTFPIVLADADIYDPVKRVGYVKYWEGKTAELAEAMQTVQPANLQGIREDIDLFDRIRDKISGLTSMLKDMNTLTPEMHQESDFVDLYHALEKRMKESKPTPSATRAGEIQDLNVDVRAKNTKDIGFSEQARTIGVSTSPREVLGTIHLSKLKELETHQSSLRMYVEGYLRLSKRRDECDTAKSILLEKGIDKIRARKSLDWSDLGEIRSSLSSASMNEVLPSDLMFGDFKTRADKLLSIKELISVDVS